MGGKSRKTGQVSQKLIDRLKNGKPFKEGRKKAEKVVKTVESDPFGLNKDVS